jgi:predicted PurR-regulated permease PerM
MANAESHRPTRYERNIGLGILILLLLGCALVLAPFFSALLWAVVVSYALWPIHLRITAWFGGRSTLSALAITLVLTAALVAPLTITVANLADDASALVNAGRGWFRSGVPTSPAWVGKVPVIGTRLSGYWDDMAREISAITSTPPPSTEPTTAPATTTARSGESKLGQTLRAIISWTRSWVIAFGLAIGGGVVQIALSLFLIFFLLRDGQVLGERLASIALRLSGDEGLQLLQVAGGTVRGVIYGILGTAFVQGLMAGFGFLIAGVPGATLLGLITFFVSVLPMGPPLIWIPASIWLFQQGSTGWGVFMILWGIAVSSVDNVIKPWLISRGSNMPFILVFFGVLGGALAFGLIGVFIGPTLLAVAFRLIDEWSKLRMPVPATSPPPTPADPGSA